MTAGGRAWLTVAATAKPSRSGIWMSRKRRSGVPRRGDFDLCHPAVRRDAVPNRVLDERLQQQRRDHRGCRAWVDAERDAQPIAEARFLNGDVMIEQLELLLECDERTALAVERLP